MTSSQRVTAEALETGDDELMAQVQRGNGDALGALYDRYCDRAYRVARYACGDEGRAEEAVQDAFISIWRSRATYQPQRGPVAAWLLTVVRHRAIDVGRRHQRHAGQRADEAQLDARAAPDDVVAQVSGRADAHTMEAPLARLPEAQREVITLAFYGELTHTEIAAQLGLPPGTVKGRMRLGLNKLRGDIRRNESA